MGALKQALAALHMNEMRYIHRQGVNATDLGTGLDYNIFTVEGDVLVHLMFGQVTTVIGATANLIFLNFTSLVPAATVALCAVTGGAINTDAVNWPSNDNFAHNHSLVKFSHCMLTIQGRHSYSPSSISEYSFQVDSTTSPSLSRTSITTPSWSSFTWIVTSSYVRSTYGSLNLPGSIILYRTTFCGSRPRQPP